MEVQKDTPTSRLPAYLLAKRFLFAVRNRQRTNLGQTVIFLERRPLGSIVESF